jgi:hypothetical protein
VSREIKWTQVSPSTKAFYLALVELFFDEPQLGFRAVVVPDKRVLDHARFGNSHEDFYYRMWWQLLRRLVDDQHVFRVFVDIKDTRSAAKLAKLIASCALMYVFADCASARAINLPHAARVSVSGM